MSAAQAWTSQRGRCFRMVDDDMGCADHCASEPVGIGWREYQGHWLALDACGEHLSQLGLRPGRRNLLTPP